MVDRSDDITDYMAESPRVLILNKVGAGDMTEIIQQDLAESIRYIEKERAQMDDLPLLNTAGKQDLGAGITVGITNTLLNTQFGFEARTTSVSSGAITTGNADGILLIDNVANFIADGVTKGALVLNLTDDGAVGTVLRVVDLNTLLLTTQMSDGNDNQFEVADVYKVWNVEQCIISGGNLVAVESDLETTMDAIFPTAFTQIVLTSSSSATLQELAAIQFSSFQGGVSIDIINGQSGIDYPIGTSQYPVNNFTDANSIATTRGFNTFFIIGNATCTGHNLDGLVIVGENEILTTLTLSSCSTEGTEFKEMTITGAFDGKVSLHHCKLDAPTGFVGTAHNCVLNTAIGLGGSFGDVALFLECWLGSSMIGGVTTIDMNGDGATLNMRGHAGAVKIINKTGNSKVAIDFLSGRIIIDSTVEAGTFYIRGVGEISENLGTGITIYDEPLVRGEDIRDTKKKVMGLY